jgi:hypothetical protein
VVGPRGVFFSDKARGYSGTRKPIRFGEQTVYRRSGNWGPPVSNSWNSTSNTARWERGFAALSRFREREGHCRPSRYHVEGKFDLGQWVSIQRYRKDDLSVERKRRLDRIGFIWNWNEYRWENSFKNLLKFRNREGHCRVPIFHNEGRFRLGWWVSGLRARQKKLSGERKARLNKIGFVWKADRGGRAHRRYRSSLNQRRAVPAAWRF